ncbi:MAG: hypothetical protein HN904_17155 [Victivallales bacterium]|nr:hypothetical protein [Victivallales bacterium]
MIHGLHDSGHAAVPDLKRSSEPAEVAEGGSTVARTRHTEHANRAPNSPVTVTAGGQRKAVLSNRKTSDGICVPISSLDTNGPAAVAGLQLIAEYDKRRCT